MSSTLTVYILVSKICCLIIYLISYWSTNFLDNFLVLLGFDFRTSSSSSSLVLFYFSFNRFLFDIFSLAFWQTCLVHSPLSHLILQHISVSFSCHCGTHVTMMLFCLDAHLCLFLSHYYRVVPISQAPDTSQFGSWNCIILWLQNKYKFKIRHIYKNLEVCTVEKPTTILSVHVLLLRFLF